MRAFWTREIDCIVNARICDVNQKSYLTKNPSAVIESAEAENKRKHLNSCLEQRRCFTPFGVSCEGMMGREADSFICRLSKRLTKRWFRPYSKTVSFVRTRFAISLVRAKNICLRGSRVMTDSISRRVDWEDGVSMGFFSTLE